MKFEDNFEIRLLTSAAESISQSILDEFMCKVEYIKIINKTIYKHVKKLLADTQRQAHETPHIDSEKRHP